MEVTITLDFTKEPRADWTQYRPRRNTSVSPPCRIEKKVDKVVQADVPRILFAEAALNDQASMYYAYDDGLMLQMVSTNADDPDDTATFGVFVELPTGLSIRSISVSADYDWAGFERDPGPAANALTYMGQVAVVVTKSLLLDFSPERPYLIGGDTVGGGQQFAFNTLDSAAERWFGTRLNGPQAGYYDPEPPNEWKRVNYTWVPFDCQTLGFQAIADRAPVYDPALPPEAAPSNASGMFNLGLSVRNESDPRVNKALVGFGLSQSRPTPPGDPLLKVWDYRNFDGPERQFTPRISTMMYKMRDLPGRRFRPHR